MKNLVLAFSGKIASGKTTISREVAHILNWPWVSFGDFIRSVARERGLEESREVLQELGEKFVKEEQEWLCQKVLSQEKWAPGGSLIIDGIRHIEILNKLKTLVYPSELFLITIHLDEEIRIERLQKHGISLRNIELTGKHSTEQQNDLLIQTADLLLDGSKEIEDLLNIIITWIQNKSD